MYVNPRMLDFEKRRLYVTAIPAYVQQLIEFIKLKDTPTSYSGEAGKAVKVNVAEDALEFAYVEDASIYSQDYGLKWADLGVITTSAVYDIAYLGNGIVIAPDAGGYIFRSVDYGATWTNLGDITGDTNYSIANLGNGTVVIGDASGHIWRSIDYGLSWSDLGAIGADSIRTMAYLGNGVVIFGDDDYKIFRSTDYGANWSDLGVVATDAFRASAYLGNDIAVIGGDDYHIYRSTDYGANWTDLGAITAGGIHAIVYLGNGVVVLGDYDFHIWWSVDYGATWVDLGDVTGSQIYTMAYVGNGVVILGTNDYHVWRSTDYGLTWTDLGVITTDAIYTILYLGNGVAIFIDNDKHIWRSTSAFHTWEEGLRYAQDVNVAELSVATYDDVQDYINFFGDRTLLSGGGITDNSNGTAAVASGTAWAKATDSDTAMGKFFNFSADNSVALTDLITNYVYLDYNAGTPQIVVSTDILTHGFKQDHIHIATIFRNGNTLHYHEEDAIGIGRINIVDMYHLEAHDADRASGLITTDGGSRTLSITAGVIYEGLNRHGTTVNGSTWSTWYYDGDLGGGAAWVEVTGQSTIDNANYNNVATGLVNLTSNRYAVHWVYVDIDGENLLIVYGQGDYTANQAEEAGVPASLPDIAVHYGVLIAKVIVKQGQTALTITYPWTHVFTSSLATDHNSLANLTTGDVHTQYVKHALATAANDFLVASGSGVYVKNTLAQVRTLIKADTDIADAITKKHTQGTDTALGTLTADINFATYKAIAMTCDNGATVPTSPSPTTGQWFLHTPTGRKVLMMYDGANWLPIISIGSMTVYVDSANGTDDVDHGGAINASAFATIQYAIDRIPAVIGGNVIIYIDEADDTGERGTGQDYAEAVVIRGKQLGGDYSISIYGQVSEELANTTMDSGVQGTADIEASVTKNAAFGAANSKRGMLCHLTKLAGAGADEYRVIHFNDANTLTLCGEKLSAIPAANDEFEILDWDTTTDSITVADGQKNVKLYDLEFVVTTDVGLHIGSTTSAAQAAAYAYRIKGAGGHGGIEAFNEAFCYVENSYFVTDNANRRGMYPDGLSFIWAEGVFARGLGRGIYTGGGSLAYVRNGCCFEGTGAGAGLADKGIWADTGSTVIAYHQVTKSRIGFCKKGLSSQLGGKIVYADLGIRYADVGANTADEDLGLGGYYSQYLKMGETAAAPTAVAGYGYVYIDDAAPTELYFEDDAGGTEQISSSYMLFVWDKTTRQYLRYYRVRDISDFKEEAGTLSLWKGNRTEDLSLVEYKLYPKQELTLLYEDVQVDIDGEGNPIYEKRIAWQTIDSLNLVDFTVADLPISEHIGKLIAVNPSQAKPATVRRRFLGKNYDVNYLVTQNIVNMWASNPKQLNIDDFVLVSFIEEMPNETERNIAIVTAKIYKSW